LVINSSDLKMQRRGLPPHFAGFPASPSIDQAESQ